MPSTMPSGGPYCLLRAPLLGTLNAGPIAGPPVPFSRSQEPVWGAAGAYSACVCVNARTAGFSALAYPQGTSSKLGSDRGEPGWVSRSCWTNQQIGHQPYEIGRDASAFKLSHDRGTETPSTERVKPIERRLKVEHERRTAQHQKVALVVRARRTDESPPSPPLRNHRQLLAMPISMLRSETPLQAELGQDI
ncbi:hypothetical protein M440DRAFT_1392261 [Trichoderma longibrachiatum ATCC 18648]|uniref:Uncharacterized protein n=1 Tax=Trichoderma longibrachiatum ATCC 18648 TaxID=983965 RepID=A0A2T4C2J4_TRILO|nr:hypothetical protein M440DRAFT_1392261 [Trichoderma longibrachiatum ATCC 18648]